MNTIGQLYRIARSLRHSAFLNVELALRPNYRGRVDRTEKLLEALEGCTIFNTLQRGYKGGAYIDIVGDMHEHARFLYDLGVALEARNILEFGIGTGQSTLFLAAVAAKTGGKLISLDPREKHKQFVAGNLRYWGLEDSCDLRYGEDSFTFRTTYHEHYADKPIDMILVDSGHTYAMTKKEIELWLPLLREGGVMIFHDVVWCFDSVQLAVDDFLKDKKVAFIKSDGFFKEQCDRCNNLSTPRPRIGENGRPTEQSSEGFDAPERAKERTFFDYPVEEITPDEAARRGYEYSYEMRTNCCGIGILTKHVSDAVHYSADDSVFESNWNETPQEYVAVKDDGTKVSAGV